MITRLPLLFLLTLTFAPAQAPVGEPVPVPKPKPGARSLRLLPLGEPPPFRQVVRDGVRYELEPDANSIPPRQVVRVGDPAAARIQLNLRKPTSIIPISPGSAPVVLGIPSGTPDKPPTPWLSITPPEAGDVLAVVWRDPETPWLKPLKLVLPDSAAAFPTGRVRIVNLLPAEAVALLGTERLLIPPGKTVMKEIPLGKDLGIQLAYRKATGESEPFYSASLLLSPNERAQVFLHRDDSEAPRRPAKAVIFNEATPPAPPAPPGSR